MPPVVNIAVTSAWYFRLYTEHYTRYRRSWCRTKRGWGTVMGSSVQGGGRSVVVSRVHRADETPTHRFSDTPETGSNPTMIDLINWSE